MENVTLDRAVELVRALGPEDQSQLRALMDSWRTEMPAETTPEQQRRLAERLLAEGIIVNLNFGNPQFGFSRGRRNWPACIVRNG